MKRLIASATVIASLIFATWDNTAHAEEWHHGGGHYVYRHGVGAGWVVPTIIGGVIGYELAQPRRPDVVVVQPQPMYAPPPPPAYQAPYGYHWEAMLDGNCNCYRSVLVPN